MLSEDVRSKIERLLVAVDPSAGVVFLPESFDDDGKGVYDDALIHLAKVFTAQNVDVAWAQQADQRTYSARRSAAEVIWGAVLSFPVGMASTLAVDALKRWLREDPQKERRVQINVAWAETPDGTTWTWQSYSAPADRVADELLPPEISDPPE